MDALHAALIPSPDSQTSFPPFPEFILRAHYIHPQHSMVIGVVVGVSLSEPHIDEFAVEFVYIYTYIYY